MKKQLITIVAPALFVLTTNIHAGIVPYKVLSVQETKAIAQGAASVGYDQNADSFVTADEVEAELREKAVNQAIDMQKSGKSQADINSMVSKMESSVEKAADAIVDALDKDGDELVEPEEIK